MGGLAAAGASSAVADEIKLKPAAFGLAAGYVFGSGGAEELPSAFKLMLVCTRHVSPPSVVCKIRPCEPTAQPRRASTKHSPITSAPESSVSRAVAFSSTGYHHQAGEGGADLRAASGCGGCNQTN